MSKLFPNGQVFKLTDIIDYEAGKVKRLDLINEANLRFALLSFDENVELPLHRAPGEVLVSALEGQAIISYKGQNFNIKAGENFRFNKDDEHFVKSVGKFKMSLMITL